MTPSARSKQVSAYAGLPGANHPRQRVGGGAEFIFGVYDSSVELPQRRYARVHFHRLQLS